MSDMNVVPYIDVMLVLLIIFMVTAPLVTQGVKVDLPQVESTPIQPEDQQPVVITIDSTGRLYVDYGGSEDEPLAIDGLITRVSGLLEQKPGIPVYLKGDRNVPYGSVVEVMEMLSRSGVKNVGLISEPPLE
ncbi:MAG: protein TolR [Gammaproteobacteria bacterium]|nr:protein TolR [Gammaproteobacteria bacterium]